MNVEKEINRLKEDVKDLYKLVGELKKEKEIRFPCFLPNTNRECTWRCPAHSEHASLKLKHGWKEFKTKVFTKGYCKLFKLMEEGKVPKELWELIKGR